MTTTCPEAGKYMCVKKKKKLPGTVVRRATASCARRRRIAGAAKENQLCTFTRGALFSSSLPVSISVHQHHHLADGDSPGPRRKVARYAFGECCNRNGKESGKALVVVTSRHHHYSIPSARGDSRGGDARGVRRCSTGHGL